MKRFFKKLFSPTVFWNFFGMAVMMVVLFIALWMWMNKYTHHGEKVSVPNLKGMLVHDAEYALGRLGLICVITDSSYNKSLPAGTILDQIPASGNNVKSGREIYVNINSNQVPTIAMPDIADNCSLREAEAKLKALGFKLGPTEYVPGDKDWVMGVKWRGNQVYAGERIPIDEHVILVVGEDENAETENEWDEWSEDSLILQPDTITEIAKL